VFVLNPGQSSLRAFEKSWLLQRTIVGHWVWERGKAFPFWEEATSSYDEIWAPTNLMLESFMRAFLRFDGSMRVVPYAIDKDPFPEASASHRREVRNQESLRNLFVVGYSCAMGSNYCRENPEGAIAAFQSAFPTEADCCLMLRSSDADACTRELAKLQMAIGDDGRIRLYGNERPLALRNFYAALDVYLSTSRAPGCGLDLVEAAQSGLPVIAGRWRIAEEILLLPGVQAVGYRLEKVGDSEAPYRGAPEAVWANPNVMEMAAALRSIYDARNTVRSLLPSNRRPSS
jgi:glycosyltransferase involved in cell wall biosynthesis